jgi:hypothetical protein
MEVQKVENISYAAFMHEFYLRSIPVILKNAANYTRPNWLDGLWFTRCYRGSATELFIERPGETRSRPVNWITAFVSKNDSANKKG